MRKRLASEALGSPAAVELSSDEEPTKAATPAPGAEALAAATPLAAPARPTHPVVRLLVDSRERLRDVEPRGLLERLVGAVAGPRTSASRRRLRLGDFAWVAGPDGCDDADCSVLECVVERKRIQDLVGRSAVGDHIRQLQRLECCGLRHPFLLLEGETRQASACPVYDEDQEAGASARDAIYSEEDVEDLCARLLVTHSSVGVVMTKDVEGTTRLLASLTAWLQWRVEGVKAEGGESAVAASQPQPAPVESFRHFEAAAAGRATARRELAGSLRASGVPQVAAEAVGERFRSLEEARAALLACASPVASRHLFDFAPACVGIGERLCAALGVAAEPVVAGLPVVQRSVRILASPGLLQRLGDPPSGILMDEAPTLWPDAEGGCSGEIVACGRLLLDGRPSGMVLRSARLSLLVLPGRLLLSEVLAASARLGASAPTPALAEAAAASLAATLASGLPAAPEELHTPGALAGRRAPRLVILEGLRAAVIAASRSPELDAGPLLPRLQGVVELAALTLDLRTGWRVRVHEARAAAATSRFVRALVRVAFEEAALSFVDAPAA